MRANWCDVSNKPNPHSSQMAHKAELSHQGRWKKPAMPKALAGIEEKMGTVKREVRGYPFKQVSGTYIGDVVRSTAPLLNRSTLKIWKGS